MFKSRLFYVKIYRNRMEVINLDTEQKISRESDHKFSTNRIILAEFPTATAFLSSILEEVDTQRSLFGQRKFVIQQFPKPYDALTGIEKTALKEITEHCKGITVNVVDQEQELTIAQALKEVIQ